MPSCVGVDLRRGGDLHGRFGPVLDRLGGREPDQREPDATNARHVGVGLHRVEEGPARERRVFVPEVRPGHLGEDPGFLGPVADRLERGERLPVEVEGARQVTATRCQLGEAAERQAGSFLVADPLLDLERLGVPRLRRVEVARDGVEDAVEGRGEPLGPGEAEGAAPLDALPRPPERRLRDRIRAARGLGGTHRCRARDRLRALPRCDTPRPTRRSPARTDPACTTPVPP